jgi:flavin reductase (DIM6/NTAB) family NADH-FMN oxidoreductase RutF
MDTDHEGRFDRITAALDGPMIVVTTASQQRVAGCLVGFHTQSSIDPRRYTLWLSKANHTYRVALRASAFGLHFLDVADLDLAERFGTTTGERVDKFSGLAWTEGLGGVPLLQRCPHRVEAERVAILDDGSDHVCVTTNPIRATGDGEFTPLRLSAVAHLEASHDNSERAPLVP